MANNRKRQVMFLIFLQTKVNKAQRLKIMFTVTYQDRSRIPVWTQVCQVSSLTRSTSCLRRNVLICF